MKTHWILLMCASWLLAFALSHGALAQDDHQRLMPPKVNSNGKLNLQTEVKSNPDPSDWKIMSDPGQQASAQLTPFADTDGDGIIDEITVVSNGIRIVHGGTGTTKLYPYSGVSFSLSTFIKDTDGVPGDEIIVLWAGAAPSNGIDVIHDRTGGTKHYQQDRQFSISDVSDTDGEAGNEIIVIWAGAVPNNGIQVIHDRTGATKNYQQNRQFGINFVRDTDGEPGNEIVVYWAGAVPNNGIQVIHDRTGTTNNYQQNRQFSISNVTDTDGEPGNEIIVIWVREFPDNGIDIIHDRTKTTNRYPQNTTFSIGGIRDYDGISGAEICISWFSGSTLYAVIVDRTRKTIRTSGCDVSQASRSFRTRQSGDWGDNLTWEEFIPNIGWTYPASQIPNIGHGAINIGTGHAVNIRSFDATVKQLTVDGTLQVTDTLQISGTLNVNGTLINNGTTQIFGTVAINRTGATASGNDFIYTGPSSQLVFYGPNSIDNGTVFWPGTNGPARVTVFGNVTLNGTRTVTDTLGVGGTLHVVGTLTNNGTTNVTGTLDMAGTLINNGTIKALTGGIEVSGKFTNNGTVQLNWFIINPGGTVSGKDFIYDKVWRGTLVFNSSHTINNSTVFWPRQNGPADITISRSISVTVNAARAVSGVLQIDGALQVADTLTTNVVSGGGTLQVDGKLIANGMTRVKTLVVAGTFTNQGTLENWGTCQISGTLTNNGTTTSYGPYEVSGTLINNGTQSFHTCQVSGTLINNGTTHINFTFQLDQGGVASGNDFTYNGNGMLVFNNSSGAYEVGSKSVFWPKTKGPANVALLGAGGITMNVARTVQQFEAAAAVTNADSLTITGTVSINPGGSFDSPPIYSDEATLIYGSNGAYHVGMEWGSGTAVGAGIPMNVRINYGATVNMPSSPRTCPGYLYNDGTLVLNTTPGADLSVGGNWRNAGIFEPNSRTVIFNGTTEQSIGSVRRENTFDYLTVNNPAGVLVNGQEAGEEGDEEIASVTVQQTLTFIAGNIRLRLGLLTLSGTVSGVSSNRHVVTYEKGRVVRAIAADSSFQFPIGPTETSYNPLTITLAPDDTMETFSVRVDSTVASNDSLFVQRTWDIQEATPGDNHAALTFQWAGAEEGAKFIRNASSTYLNGDELVQNEVVTGADPYVVTTKGGFPCTEFASFTIGTSGNLTAVAGGQNGAPTAFMLNQNYPNPFNPATTIRYALAKSGHVTLKMYDLSGKQIETLVNENQPAGEYKIRWNPVGVPSGVYFYRLRAGEFVATRKLILLR